jgi:hypothetical protein
VGGEARTQTPQGDAVRACRQDKLGGYGSNSTTSGRAASEPRRIERSLIVGGFAARKMKPGVVLPARVNPRDEDDVLIVW